jgi:S1-C subfamily serine protease
MLLPKNTLRAVFFALVLLTNSSVAQGGTRDPSTPDKKYVEFGQKFPFVIRFCAHHDGTDDKGDKYTENWCASGVVIRKHWVLTAAHVVFGAERATVTTDDNKKFKLAKIIRHKDYKSERVGWHDIALARTEEPIELEFYPALHRDADELDKAVTFAGWGLTGTFHTGATLNDHKRRAGHNKIDGAADAVLFCSASKGAERFPLEFMIAPGDSGGGMFIGNELAGINSFLLADDGKPKGIYGNKTAFTRVSLYATWVDEQIEQHELALLGQATTGAKLDNVQP